jgi:tetratricopeptide (TPR) repeat protein
VKKILLGFYTIFLDSLLKVIMLSLESKNEKSEFNALFDFEYNLLLTLGLNLIQQGEVDSAIRFFQELSLSDLSTNLTYFYLGNLHTIKDELEIAIGYYSLAWETNSNPDLAPCLPSKVLFTLITMDYPDKEILKLWLKRAEKFVQTYSCDELLIVDYASRLLEKL